MFMVVSNNVSSEEVVAKITAGLQSNTSLVQSLGLLSISVNGKDTTNDT